MPNRVEKEKLFGANIYMVDQMIAWLQSWQPKIGPRYSRKDNVIGLTWEGRNKDFNKVYFRQLKEEFRIGLRISVEWSAQVEEELRRAGLAAWYSRGHSRLLVRLTPKEFERHKSLLKRLLRATVEGSSVSPHSGRRMARYEYTVVIERDEDGVYISTCPALQGCHSNGETYQEALENLKEAIQLHVEARQNIGEPVPIEIAVERVEINVEAAPRKTA